MLKGKRVLSIDDSDTIRTYLRNVLTPLGATLEDAATGQEGLEKCTRIYYDLILLDLLLPDIDGIRVLRRIRERNDTSSIVMLTGHGGIKSAISAIQLGADGYLQKQDMTTAGDSHAEFLYALEQALKHRAGYVAQKQQQKVQVDPHLVITHELRDPSDAILTAIEALLRSDTRSLTPEQRQYLSIIHAGAQRLANVIDDYLKPARVSVTAETHRASDTFAPTTPEQETKEAPLDFSEDPEFRRLFFEESQEHIHTLQNTISRLYFTPQDRQLAKVAHRTVHTLKGNALSMQQIAIYELAAQMDDVLKQSTKGSLALTQAHVRSLAQLLDRITQALAREQQSAEAGKTDGSKASAQDTPELGTTFLSLD